MIAHQRQEAILLAHFVSGSFAVMEYLYNKMVIKYGTIHDQM
jgi:hypothetical protein